LATLDDDGTCTGVCDHGSPSDLHVGHDFDDRIWFSSTGAKMIQETLVQELQKTFERVAEIIRANDLGSGTKAIALRTLNDRAAEIRLHVLIFVVTHDLRVIPQLHGFALSPSHGPRDTGPGGSLRCALAGRLAGP
jgi:hypothetical protein